MTKFTIPTNRENVGNKEFKKLLEERKLTKEQEDKEKYIDLRYNIISFCSTKGFIIAIIFWIFAYFFNHQEIKDICLFYIQTVVTLYIGYLISKT